MKTWRYAHAETKKGEKIYIMSGCGQGNCLTECECFDLKSKQFKDIQRTIQPAHSQASFSEAAKVFCLGGHSDNVALDNVIYFDEAKNQWDEFPLRLPAPSGCIAGQKIAGTVRGFVVWSH